jgi:hypothetical protein
LTFIESLLPVNEAVQETESRPLTASDLLESGLVGIWADRSDIGDRREFARRLHEQAETRSREWSCWIPMSWSTSSAVTRRPLPGSGDLAPLFSVCRDWSWWNSFKVARIFWPTQADCQRALTDYSAYRLSHGIGLLDVLIGHTAVGLNEPLATFNIKHYRVITGLIAVQPYWDEYNGIRRR